MKFLLITLLFLKMLHSKIEKNDISSKTVHIKKTRKGHSERILFGVNENLKRILAQRSKFFKTERNLKLNPNKHLDLVVTAKNKVLGFGWKKGEFSFGQKESQYRTKDGKLKLLVALENRYPIRNLQKNNMQCTLHVKNHGIDYVRKKRISRFRVDFRSNCFRNTYTKYYIGANMHINPIEVKIDLDFVQVLYQFKNDKVDYNFSYIIKPVYYAQDMENQNNNFSFETEVDNKVAHTKTKKKTRLPLRIGKKKKKKKKEKRFKKKKN